MVLVKETYVRHHERNITTTSEWQYFLVHYWSKLYTYNFKKPIKIIVTTSEKHSSFQMYWVIYACASSSPVELTT